MKRVEAIIKPFKLDEVKAALNAVLSTVTDAAKKKEIEDQIAELDKLADKPPEKTPEKKPDQPRMIVYGWIGRRCESWQGSQLRFHGCPSPG